MSESHLSFWPDRLDPQAGRRIRRDGPSADEAPRPTQSDARPGRPQRDGDLGFAPALRRPGADLPTDEPAPLGARFAIELVDERGDTLHRLTTPVPQPHWVEHFRPDGTMGWSLEPQPLSIDLPAEHSGAVMALVSRDGWAESLQVPVAHKPQGPCQIWRNDLKPDVAVPIVLVAERFSDPERFWQACEQLEQRLLDSEPFRQSRFADKVGVVGLWWPQTKAGLFDTRFEASTRRLLFDRQIVFRLTQTVRRSDVVVLVDDIDDWAGVGGEFGRAAAATSIYGFDPAWTGIPLHEVGHSFGLQDEYDTPGVEGLQYDKSFPNVSDQSDPAQTPWKDYRTAGYNDRPTQNNQHQPAVGPGVIGTFQGALYDKVNFYRPTANCRMRDTTANFCPVCKTVIEDELEKL